MITSNDPCSRQVSGILDFEWALAGDAAYDFMIASVRERMVPESELVLMAGYQSLRPRSPHYDWRLFWYRLFLQLEEAARYHEMGENENTMDSLKRLHQLIDMAEHSST